MKKVTQLVLMLCLILSGAFSYAHGMARTEKEKVMGDPRLTIQKAQHGGVDKSENIVASIYGHVLSVVFTENLGEVAVEITTISGATVDYFSMLTPNGAQFYIPNAGNYIVTFTLTNGDEYYGEFEVLN